MTSPGRHALPLPPRARRVLAAVAVGLYLAAGFAVVPVLGLFYARR